LAAAPPCLFEADAAAVELVAQGGDGVPRGPLVDVEQPPGEAIASATPDCALRVSDERMSRAVKLLVGRPDADAADRSATSSRVLHRGRRLVLA